MQFGSYRSNVLQCYCISNIVYLAAHCCHGYDEALVHFGQGKKADVMSAEFSLSSTDIFIHHEYSQQDQNYDVCLIKIKESISTVAMNTCGMSNVCVAQTCLPLTGIRQGLACWISGSNVDGNIISS